MNSKVLGITQEKNRCHVFTSKTRWQLVHNLLK